LEVEVIKAKRNLTDRSKGKKIDRMRVAAYCLVSTDSEDQLHSYRSQLQYYTDLIEKNKELKKEVLTLRDYIDKTFEYVSLLFDFSKDRLKRLVNSFIYSLNKEK